jgi:hypothetical protein
MLVREVWSQQESRAEPYSSRGTLQLSLIVARGRLTPPHICKR